MTTTAYELPKRARNLRGMKFGRLTAITPLPPNNPREGCRWECICDCGNNAVVKASLLTYKNGTRSCGCILAEFNRSRPKTRPSTNIKHGHSSRGVSPEYVTWSSMIQRCTNPKHESYHLYGGRGITICQEWRDSFEAFFRDMGCRPAKNYSLDRLDNFSGYSKENCRWASSSEQANNRRNNVSVIVGGMKISVPDACAKFNISYRTMYRWAKCGKDVAEKLNVALAKRPSVASH